MEYDKDTILIEFEKSIKDIVDNDYTNIQLLLNTSSYLLKLRDQCYKLCSFGCQENVYLIMVTVLFLECEKMIEESNKTFNPKIVHCVMNDVAPLLQSNDIAGLILYQLMDFMRKHLKQKLKVIQQKVLVFDKINVPLNIWWIRYQIDEKREVIVNGQKFKINTFANMVPLFLDYCSKEYLVREENLIK